MIDLERPLVFFDLESTGPDPATDRIVQYAFVKITEIDGTEIRSEQLSELVNPGIHIPIEASGVHGIADDMIKDMPAFDQHVNSIAAFVNGCDYAGFNIIRYDLPLLRAEFKRCGRQLPEGKIVDSLAIFYRKEPRDLQAAHKYYCGQEFSDAHDAIIDTKATVNVFMGQLKMYQDLRVMNVSGLHEFCNQKDDRYVDSERKFYWRDGEATFTFGKYCNVTLKEVAKHHSDYLRWFLRNDLSDEIKNIFQEALAGKFPKK